MGCLSYSNFKPHAPVLIVFFSYHLFLQYKCSPRAGSAQSLYCSGVQTVEVPVRKTKIQCSCYTGQMMHLWCDWADCEFIPGMWTILQLQFSSRYRVSQSMRQALMLYVEKYSESMGVDLQSPHGGGRYWSCNSKRHILCLRESAGRDERRTQGRPRTGAEEDNKPTKPNTHFKHKWKQSTN